MYFRSLNSAPTLESYTLILRVIYIEKRGLPGLGSRLRRERCRETVKRKKAGLQHKMSDICCGVSKKILCEIIECEKGSVSQKRCCSVCFYLRSSLAVCLGVKDKVKSVCFWTFNGVCVCVWMFMKQVSKSENGKCTWKISASGFKREEIVCEIGLESVGI